MTTWAARAKGALLASAAATLLLTGCGQPDPVPDATQLTQNQPQSVDGHRVIAYNMDDESGYLDIDGPEGTTQVRVGSTVTIGDTDYEVVQIVESSGDHPDGWISIRER